MLRVWRVSQDTALSSLYIPTVFHFLTEYAFSSRDQKSANDRVVIAAFQLQALGL